MLLPRAAARSGSSPRMRGTPGRRRRENRRLRFIPAHAGNTAADQLRAHRRAVHPRACGEHSRDRAPVLSVDGSSPRMRGTRPRSDAEREARRFIPAHAGNTLDPARRLGSDPVHPRACGEHASTSICSMTLSGSSPRMRGTRLRQFVAEQGERFIPAHAGNTSASRSAWRAPTVHPRACGEHAIFSASGKSASGSSPRMRGTHSRAPMPKPYIRFIPAHAGNTLLRCGILPSNTVHPRACGEHWDRPRGLIGGAGSSPRMRGTLFLQVTKKFTLFQLAGNYQ